VYVTDLLGGRRAIPEPEGIRTILGPQRSWNRVRDFITARGIKAEIEGPYFLKVDSTSGLEWPDAVVYIRFLDPEQEVLWSSELIEFGVDGSELCDLFEDLKHHQWTPEEFQGICGGHPGEHFVARIDRFDVSKAFPKPRY